jgi:iron uptake system component EfeO
MTAPRRRGSALAMTCAVLSLPFLAGCTDNAPAAEPGSQSSANPRVLTVQATDSACSLSAAAAPSGKLSFSVANGGT